MSETPIPPVTPPAAGGSGAPVTPPAPNLDWMQFVPEDVRTSKVFESVKAKDEKEALGIISKQLVHAQSQLGKDRVLKPQADWKPEELKKWQEEVLGVPKEAKAYAIDKEAYKEVIDDKGIEELQNLFLQSGLTPAQATSFSKAFLDKALTEGKTARDSEQATLAGWEDTLKKDWGASYEKNQQLVSYTVDKFAQSNPQLKTAIEQDPTLLKNPGIAKILKDVGALITEGGTFDQFKGGTPVVTSASHPIEIQRRLAEISKDDAFGKVMANGGPAAHVIQMRINGDEARGIREAEAYKGLLAERTRLYAQLAEAESKNLKVK